MFSMPWRTGLFHFWMSHENSACRRIKCCPAAERYSRILFLSELWQKLREWQRIVKVRIERKESQLLNYIKLHMVVDVPFCRIPYPFESSAILLLPSLWFQKPSKSYNCQRENAENRCLRRPTWAFSRSVKLIARYYSHSTGWTVIRPDASRITTVRCPRMRQKCSFHAIENCFKA